MTEHTAQDSAEQRLAELGRLLLERERESERLRSLDRRIAELAGLGGAGLRKGKCMSPREFRRGCNIA